MSPGPSLNAEIAISSTTKIQKKNPLFAEAIPLTLEEIFISETEVAGSLFWVM